MSFEIRNLFSPFFEIPKKGNETGEIDQIFRILHSEDFSQELATVKDLKKLKIAKQNLSRLEVFSRQLDTNYSQGPDFKDVIKQVERASLSAKPSEVIAVEKPDFYTPSPSEIDARLFIHIHGDAFAKGASPLEGMPPIEPMQFLYHYLQRNKRFNSEKISAVLSSAIKVYELINKAKLAIESCKNERQQSDLLKKMAGELGLFLKSQLQSAGAVGIPGGWVDLPFGHAVFYEVKKQEDGKFTFRAYNTGSGIDSTEGVALFEKEKHPCFLEIQDIELENLLNPTILSALIEMESFSLNPTKTEGRVDLSPTKYSAADIYQGIIPLLGGKVIPTDFKIEAVMTRQRGGTCSWKSLCAFLRSNLDFSSYKRFKYEIKLQTLIDFYQENAYLFFEDEKCLRLFKCAVEKFSREILKPQSGLSDAEVISTQRIIKSFNETMAHAERTLKETFEKNSATPSLGPLPPEIDVKVNCAISIPSTEETLIEPQKPIDENLLTLPHEWQCNRNSIVNDLSRFASMSEEALRLKHYEVLIYFINEIYAKLPNPIDNAPFFDSFSKDEATALMGNLSKLGTLLFKATYSLDSSSGYHEKSLVSMVKGQAILIYLLPKSDPRFEIKEDSGPVDRDHLIDSVFSSVINRPQYQDNKLHPSLFFSLQDKESSLEFEKLSRFLAVRRAKGLFNFGIKDLEHGTGDWSGDGHYELETKIAGSVLCQSSFLQEMEALLPDFAYLEANEKLRLLLFDFRMTPKGLAALRDQSIYTRFFMRGPFVKQVGFVDVEGAYDLKFTTIEKHRGISVECSLTGIDAPAIAKDHKEFFLAYQDPAERAGEFISFYFSRFGSKLVNPDLVKLFSQPRKNESELLTEDFRKKGISIPRERCIALLSCIANPPLQAVLSLDFFSSNPQLLEDRDYQTLFKCFMFDDHRLNAELARNPEFGKKLEAFVMSGYARAKKFGNIEMSLFYLNLNRLLGGFCPGTFSHIDEQKEFEELLSLPMEEVQRRELFQSWAAAFAANQSIDEKGVINFLYAKIALARDPLPKESVDGHLVKDASTALLHLSPQIKKHLLMNANLIIPEVLRRLGIKEIPKSWHPLEYPLWQSEDGNYSIDILKGTLFHLGKEERALPEEMTLTSDFQYLFGNKKIVGIPLGPNHFLFQDEKGVNCKAIMTPNGIAIQREMEKGHWMQFIPRKHFFIRDRDNVYHSKISSRALVEEYDQWVSVDLPGVLRFVDHKEMRSDYEAKVSSKTKTKGYQLSTFEKAAGYSFALHSIVPTAAKNLTLANLTDCSGKKELQFLEQFENLAYVHLWKEEDALKAIELPRYGLHFTVKGGKIESDEFRGFHIAKKQTLDALPGFSHCIVLENDLGEKKVIIPKQEINNTTGGALSTEITFNLQLDEMGKSQTYFVYEVNKVTEQLKTLKVEESLYLAYLFLAKHEYKQALGYLVQKTHRFSIAEMALLDQIITLNEKSKDHFPQAIAIRLHASVLKIQNSAFYGSGEGIDFTEYPIYLDTLHNIPPSLRLTCEEELVLLEESFGPRFALRKKMLLGEDIEPGAPLIPKKEEESSLFWKEAKGRIEEINNRCKYAGDNQVPSTLVTRFGEHIYHQFFDLYDLCKKGSLAQKEELRQKLLFSVNDPNINVKVLCNLLQMVLTYPEEYPELYAHVRKATDSNFFQSIVKKSAELAQKKAKAGPAGAIVSSLVLPKRDPVLFENLAAPHTFDETHLEEMLTDCVERHFESKVIDATSRKDEIAKPIAELSEALRAKKGDKLLGIEAERIQKDIAKWHQSLSEVQEFSLKDVEALADELQGFLERNEGLLADQEREILALANKMPQDPLSRAKKEVMLTGHNLEPLTLNDLLLLFLKKESRGFKERNPDLNDQEIAKIQFLIAQFLNRTAFSQQMERTLRLIADLRSSDQTSLQARDIVQDIAYSLRAKREYTISEHPEYLVFEVFANIRLRSDQRAKLDLFLKGDYSQPVLQMIMGAGKTKVLLPILALLKADGNRLSMIITPESLYEETMENMRVSSKGAFSQGVTSFDFERDSNVSSDSLRAILKKLESTRTNRGVLVTTSKSMQCLYLKYLEMAYTHPEDERLQLLKQILSFFKEKGDVIIDEADLVLNARQEVNFTFGSPHSLKQEHIDLCSFLYETLLEVSSVQFEFLAGKKLSDVPFTEELYHHAIKPLIVERLIKMWDIPGLRDYLLGLPVDPPPMSEELRDFAALAKSQLNLFLPLTLKKNCDEQYGLRGNELLAVPYVASNTPTIASHFGVPYETLNYTIQTYLKKGIPPELVDQEIKRLQKLAISEMEVGKNLEQTESYAQFQKIVGSNSGLHLFHITKRNIDEIVLRLRDNIPATIHFIKSVILPRLQVYDKKLSSNPQNLCALFARVSGFTGTLWNKESFPSSLQSIPEEGTDARTLVTLWNNSRENVHIAKTSSPGEILSEILSDAHLKNALAIIDTGGVFKGESNLSIAKRILELSEPKIKGVVFFDEDNRANVLERGKKGPHLLIESQLQENERLTYYDQRHTTGQDIKQAHLARAVVTIGRHTFMRDLLQSVWRMRRLEKGQRIEFLIPEDVKKLIGEGEVSLADLLYFCMKNQARQQGEDNYLSLRQKLRAAAQLAVFEDLSATNLDKLFLQSTEDRPFLNYGPKEEEVPAEDVIAKEASRFGVAIGDMARVLEHLPDRLYTRNIDDVDTCVEIEVKKEVEQEVKKEVEVQKPPQKIRYRNPWQLVKQVDNIFVASTIEKLNKISYPIRSEESFILSVDEVLKIDQTLKKFGSLFDPALIATVNALYVQLNTDLARVCEVPTTPFDAYQKQIKIGCLYLDQEEGDYKMLLLDQDDAEELRKIIETKGAQFKRYKPLLFSLTEGPLGPIPGGFDLNHSQVQRLLVQAKFFNGETHYSPQELPYLEAWIKEKGIPIMREFFLEHIIRDRESAKQAFDKSPLSQILMES